MLEGWVKKKRCKMSEFRAVTQRLIMSTEDGDDLEIPKKTPLTKTA